MDSPSNASSSLHRSRLPWAGVLVLVLIAFMDNTVYRTERLWRSFDDRLTGSNLLEQGLVLDRIALFEANRVRGEPSIFLLGSSRLNRGFRTDALPEKERPEVHFTKLAHPQFFPFEIRGVIEEVVSRSPDLVVLALAELETHTRLKFVPGASYGGMDEVRDLLEIAGPGFVFERRVMLERIALMGAFNTYHYRNVFDRAGLGSLRHFARDKRLKVTAFPERSVAYQDGEPREISTEDLIEIARQFDDRFPGRGSMIRKAQFGLLRSISTGRHAEINMALLARSVAKLREEGIEVLLIEPPTYPGARRLYDSAARVEFVEFAEALSRENGVRFVKLEQQEEYRDEDFGDLTHLANEGVAKFTRAVLEGVAQHPISHPAGGE